MLFFFLQVCSTLKLCCTYSWKKGIKGKEKAYSMHYQVIDLLILRKKRFADSCGWLTM
jgi:hypothetical protein